MKKFELYESVNEVFNKVYYELRELARKKPDAILSKEKVKLLNRLLVDIKLILKGISTEKYLDLLDDELLPQYSDALLILAQYLAAMEKFKSTNYSFNNGWSAFAEKNIK
ncbi:hypothetical protein [uncultured Desulfovibrio sp.]|uniref:hypothetical protein n=1 Tax=uncultured Desulfovibrio sp. TaxID=167968 RepID=UPI002868D41F|nr:hypothetical protein [uncultured Desulfovibrio sp.]